MAHKLLRLMVPEPETPFGGLQQVFYAYMVQRYSTYDYEQNRFEQTGRIFHYQEWIWIQVNLVQIVCSHSELHYYHYRGWFILSLLFSVLLNQSQLSEMGSTHFLGCFRGSP